MTHFRDDPPTQAPPSPSPEATAIVLPRPNLGPEPWSDPPIAWTPIGLIAGAVMAVLLAAIMGRKWFLDIQLRRGIATPDGLQMDDETDDSPDRRLIASSRVVRGALIAEFGPTWGSRTTEEVARDPALATRLGPDAALALVAYLQRVDRAKFAGDDSEDADLWIGQSEALLAGLARRPSGRRGG